MVLNCNLKRLSNGIGKLKKVDSFGPIYNIDITSESRSLATSAGAILTIVMYVTISVYAYLRGDVFLSKSSMDLL